MLGSEAPEAGHAAAAGGAAESAAVQGASEAGGGGGGGRLGFRRVASSVCWVLSLFHDLWGFFLKSTTKMFIPGVVGFLKGVLFFLFN